MRVQRETDGTLLLDELSVLYADALLRVPELLDAEDPDVKQRLFPDVLDDEHEREQWRGYASGELEHLFLSKKEIVARDLGTLSGGASLRYRLRIAAGHEKAWLQALNAARLALFVLNRLDKEDMEMDPAEAEDEQKELALIRIHVLAHVQEVILRFVAEGFSSM